MRRRAFIAGLSVAATMGRAQAQQPGHMRRVVFMHALAENDPEEKARVGAFRQGLMSLGWVENRNIKIEHRYSAGDFTRIQADAADLVSSAPDLVVTSSSPITAALRQATRTIPIVFVVVIDPLGQGFVASLARPGANVTGFTYIDFPMIGKWLEALKEIAPGVRRMALMFNPDTGPYYAVLLREFATAAARSLAAELSELPVRDEAEIEAAAKALAREPGAGLIVAAEPFMNARRGLIITLAERYRLPAVYGFRQFVTEGALISYGPDTADIVRRSASYVDRILKGEKAADLPVQAPTKFELAINLKTAKALALNIPTSLLARADEVIE